MKGYYIQNQHQKIMPLKLDKPLPNCQICSPKALPVTFSCNFKTFTLKQFLDFIREASPQLEEFSLNYGVKEIYNTDDPKEKLLVKTIFQLSEAFAIDLILTDEDTSKNVCVVWMVHDEAEENYTVFGKEKLVPEVETAIEEEVQKGQNGAEEDSDVIMFEEDAGEPEIEIIEVRKRDKEGEKPEATLGRKKQKVD